MGNLGEVAALLDVRGPRVVQLLGRLDAVRARVNAQGETGVGVVEVLEDELTVAVVLREEYGDEVGADVRFIAKSGCLDGNGGLDDWLLTRLG